MLAMWADAGTQKAVARELGLSHKTVANTINDARKRMAVKTSVHALLAFDRVTRGRKGLK